VPAFFASRRISSWFKVGTKRRGKQRYVITWLILGWNLFQNYVHRITGITFSLQKHPVVYGWAAHALKLWMKIAFIENFSATMKLKSCRTQRHRQ